MDVHLAVNVGRAHQQRIDHGELRGFQPLDQRMLAELVHQEADGAAMHAIDRDAGAHVPVQRLQHQAVAAQGNDDVGLVRRLVAIGRGELGEGLLGLIARARHEGNPLIFSRLRHIRISP